MLVEELLNQWQDAVSDEALDVACPFPPSVAMPSTSTTSSSTITSMGVEPSAPPILVTGASSSEAAADFVQFDADAESGLGRDTTQH